MFGPGIRIHQRERILRRRLAVAGAAGAAVLAVAFATGRWDDTPPIRHVGRPGDMVLVSDVDELSDDVRDRPTDAGGHPLPRALSAIEVEEIEPPKPTPTPLPEPPPPEPSIVAVVVDIETPTEPIVDPTPGPAVGDATQEETARPVVSASDDVVILKFVRAVYPTDARLLGVEGDVRLRLLVDTNGDVVEVQSFPDDDLLPSCVVAAERAVRQWRFKPFAEPAWVNLNYSFGLTGGAVSGISRR